MSFITTNRIIGAALAGLSGPLIVWAAHAPNVSANEYLQIIVIILGAAMGAFGAYFLLDPDSADNS